MLPTSIKVNYKCTYLFEKKNNTLRLGARSMSPMPPPFLRPWFSVVKMHITRESQARSLVSPPDSASGFTLTVKKNYKYFTLMADKNHTLR
jgi:hypothetical protein